MTVSLCPVLMNFSMQITHLNQKWNPVLFVFRQLRHQENQPCSSHCLIINHIFLAQLFCCPKSGWTEVHSCPDKTTKKQPQIFGSVFCIKYTDVSSRTVCKNRLAYGKNKQQIQLVILPHFFYVALLYIESHGTSFFELNICTCFTSLYYHTLRPPWWLPQSCFLFLWVLTGQQKSTGREKERWRWCARDLLHGSAILRKNFMNTFRSCPLHHLFAQHLYCIHKETEHHAFQCAAVWIIQPARWGRRGRQRWLLGN